MGVVGLLGHGDTQSTGIDRDLGDKTVVAVYGLDRRASQGLAVAHQLVKTLGAAWDLADHPGLQHLTELLQMGLVKQVKEGGIRRPALELQAQCLVQRLSVPLGNGLQIARAATATQDPKHRHQEQKPLGVTDPAAVAAVRNGLEEADQVIGSRLIDCGGKGFGHGKRGDPPTKPNADRTAKTDVDRLLGGPGVQ
ncbi:hypothetical protein KBY93_15570 [Synechococcus sp. J7-Johnson]|nr:hypothetical protein [Synechococcus sp. J7-Johnson]